MHFLCVRAILYGVIFTTADSNPTSTLYFSFKTDTLAYMLKLILAMWCDVILLLLSSRYTDHKNRDPASIDVVDDCTCQKWMTRKQTDGNVLFASSCNRYARRALFSDQWLSINF